MKQISKIALLILLIAMVGCTKNEAPTTSEPSSDSGELQPVEIPESALQIMQQAQRGVPEALDNMNAWPIDSLPPSLSDTTYDIYSVTLLWGQLAPGDPNTAPMDWSGTLSINGVAVIDVLSAIDFENADGDQLIAFDNPAITGWASFTPAPDLDGITCLIFLDKTVTYITAPWLTFDTDAFDTTWQFGDLEHLTAWYAVGNTAGLGIHAQKISFSACERGYLEGEWTRHTNAGDSGSFSGIWQDRNGAPVHTYAGHFWKTDDGRGVWEGWISGLMTTDIKGWMEGTWAYDDMRMCPLCGQSYGYMIGKFRWDNENAWSGKVAARFGDPSITPQDSVLSMHGAWKEDCRNSDKWGLMDIR